MEMSELNEKEREKRKAKRTRVILGLVTRLPPTVVFPLKCKPPPSVSVPRPVLYWGFLELSVATRVLV